MDPSLIRSPYKKKTKKVQVCEVISKPKPLSLLNNDRSLLTIEEWNLLSNTLHAYDEQNLVIRTQHCLKEQSSLPPKLRTKQMNTLELIGSYYLAVQPFIERSPYFSTLPLDIRKIILENNFSGTGGFNTMIAAAEANVFDNENHVARCNEIYGTDYVRESERLLTRFEPNITLLKLFLMVLMFSTHCSLVLYDHSIESINRSSTKSLDLLHIQNIFITMLWKYLVYQYGHEDAIRCFINMIKNYLDVLNHMHENVSQQHQKMVDNIIEKTTQSLEIVE